MPELFDMRARALRRDRAARLGGDAFLLERAFEDCLDRIALLRGEFASVLMLGGSGADWPERVGELCGTVEVRDPGALFAARAGGQELVEDAWLPPAEQYDLVLAIGTLDTVNDLPLALQLIRHALRPGGRLLGAMAGGNTLPRLREAMLAADSQASGAAPHVHPRIEPSALGSLLTEAGLVEPVVDLDRVQISYATLQGLIEDLRAMGATNVLTARPRFVGKAAFEAAQRAFTQAGDGTRTIEQVEILHLSARKS